MIRRKTKAIKLTKTTRRPKKITIQARSLLTKKRITINAIARQKKRALKGQKATSVTTLIRAKENPIISPQPENIWESWQTFNPGVILLNGKVHFLYRAIGSDGISRLGYAASSDGFLMDERLPFPVYEHRRMTPPQTPTSQPLFNYYSYYSFASGGSFGGAEDPRPVRVNEEDTIFMTYTACDEGLRVALTSIKVRDFLQKRWRWKAPKLISPPDEVHKNWVIFPERINGKYAILTSITPEISIEYLDNLEFENGRYLKSTYFATCPETGWEKCLRGAGPPPIKTKHGWLLFYHATDKREPGKYKVGAMLLDLNNPTKVLHRSPQPILEPAEVYENNGFKAGVVYASGAVVKDGKLLLYYGAADSYVGVAYADFDKFLEELTKGTKPELRRKALKKK